MVERGDERRLIYLILLGAFALSGSLAAEKTESPEAKFGVTGHVSDPQGSPLAGVEIWVRVEAHDIRKKHHLGEDWLDPVSGTTDESGDFSVTMEVDGPYRLFMIHPDHPPRPYEEAVENGATIEFRFPQPIVFTGAVENSDGEAIEGAEVTACDIKWSAKFGAHTCLRTRSGDDGKYTFERLAEDAYAFQAWASGYALSEMERGRFPLAEDGSKAPGTMTLERGAEVSGTVKDDAGTPFAGVAVSYSTDRVRLGQARGRRDVVPLNPILTDADGNYNFPGLPAGEPIKMSARVEKRRPAESDTLTLKAGTVVGGVDIVYQRPASATVHVIDRDEQPIEAVEVLWRPAKEGSPTSVGGFRIAGYEGLTEVESNGEGRFTISGIKPDRYTVTLLPAGHREIEIEGVRVGAGAEVDLGTHVAQPGATLSGYVIDDLGQAVEGARLEGLYMRDDTAMSRSVKSAEDGHFALGGLTEGPLFLLKVEAKGHILKSERGVDSAQTDYEVVLERVGVVSGRVLLESGDPAQGVEAVLEDVSGGILAVRRGSSASARGDENGRFEIKAAAPGTHTLRLTARTARPLRVKDVVVEAGATTDVGTHRLEEGRELTGNVLDALDGSPVAGAAVKVDVASGGLLGESRSAGTAMTDGDGRFVVGGLGAGRFIVLAEHADYAPAKTEATLEENEPSGDLTLRLGQGGTLRGTVRDESGRAAPERALGLIEGGGFSPDDRILRTNDAGEYRVERLRPGSYQVVLYPDTSGDQMNMQRKATMIREAEVTVVDFDGETKIRFEGLLTRGGRPVGEVTVVLIPTDAGELLQAKSASVDLSGRFELGLNRPGTYNVMVQDLEQGLGALVGQARIVVPDEPSVSLEIVLQSGAIVGTVLSASGDPIEGSMVSAVHEGANMNEIGSSTGAMAAPDGSYRIEGVNEGTYTLSAMGDGYQVVSRTVTLSGAETLDGIDFRLEAAGQIRGRVVDIHGNGIPGAYVFAFPSGMAGASAGMPTETDAEGFFRVSAPTDGPCDLEVVARGLAPGVVSGVVPRPESEGPGTVVTLTPGGTILVRVVNAGGEPVGGVQVGIQPERSSQALMIAMMFSPTPPTDASGTSRVSNLPDGSYRVSIAGRPGVVPQRVAVSDGGETSVTLQLP